MKQTMKRTLALLMALLLALPSFALSEDYAPAVEDAAEELEVMLDDLDAGDDEADDAIEDVDAEGAVPAGYVRVRLAVTPEKVRACAPSLAEMADRSAFCIFGGKEQIEASELNLEVIELMG